MHKRGRFLAALETGLFLIFLEHGADPHTRIYTPLGPVLFPFEELVFVGLSFQKDIAQYGADYLQVLDGFISRGAEFSPYVADHDGPLLTAGSAPDHPCEAFFSRLRKLQDDLSPDWVCFRTSVLRRVLPLAQRAQWPLSTHWALLEQALPSLRGRDIEGFSAVACEAEEVFGVKAETQTPGKRKLANDDQKERRLRRYTDDRGQPSD